MEAGVRPVDCFLSNSQTQGVWAAGAQSTAQLCATGCLVLHLTCLTTLLHITQVHQDCDQPASSIQDHAKLTAAVTVENSMAF
jgi:hypothetical protein